jgi:flagellar basal-body rod protein FlgB
MSLFDRTIGLIQKSLDLRTTKHKLLSSNIANAETPNYVSKNIPFQKVLEASIDTVSTVHLKRTHPTHLSANFENMIPIESSMGSGDIDQEMAHLAENNLMFQAGVQALVKKFEAFRMAVSEGGR